MVSYVLMCLAITLLVSSCVTGYFSMKEGRKGIVGVWFFACKVSGVCSAIVFVACVINLCCLLS